MFGTLTPPVRRGKKEIKPSNNVMDMEAIRARRARLEDIISMMRLPPLTRSRSLSQNPLDKENNNLNVESIRANWMSRRRSLDGPARSTLATSSLPDHIVPLTPMTCRPFIQPLPGINRRRLIDSIQSTPSVSRQTSGKRNLNTDSSAPEEKRPATSKSRQLILTEDSEEEDDGENIPVSDDSIEEIIRGMGSNSKEKKLNCTVKARKLLSREADPPISEFLKAGVLTPLIPLLQCSEDSTLQFEATWTLTNLASGTSEQTASVVNAGAIPILVDLLKSKHESVQEQSAWAIGNISGDGAYYRNLLVQNGVISPLLDTLAIDSSGVTAKVTLARVVSWVIANMFRHKGITISSQDRKRCLEAIKLLVSSSDKEVPVDALWAVGYVADIDDEGLEEVVSIGMVPLLITHLRSNNKSLVTPALRAIGNIVTGDDVQTNTVLDNQVLPILKVLMDDSRRNICKEAFWTVSNITAGSKNQIQRVIDADMIPQIVSAIQCGHIAVQKEATWAASNITAGGTDEQMSSLIDGNGVEALVSILSIGESNIIGVALQALHALMKVSGREEEVKDIISGEGGLRKLEVLSQYVDPTISEKAEKIMRALSDEASDDSDENDSDGSV